ncbi:MAG: hypothetical protein ACRCVT_01115 [Leadbetterella sp.]
MIKIIRYIGIVFFGFLWFLGCSTSTSKKLFDIGVLKDDFRYGDLYRLCNLERFKDEKKECLSPKSSLDSTMELIVVGDSFTEIGDNSYQPPIAYTWRQFDKPACEVSLRKKKNVLILEVVERHFRERFENPYLGLETKNIQTKIEDGNVGLTTKSLVDYSLPYDEKKHHAVLYGFDWVLKLKEWKAALNEYCFGKVDKNVTVSEDGNTVFLSLETATGVSSGFEAITDTAVNRYVNNINETYDHYKNKGFDEVYLSIIPNKSSILGYRERDYNHLVERIEGYKDLKMPVISVWNDFRNSKSDVYSKGDTHWNCEGRELWKNKVLKKLNITK